MSVTHTDDAAPSSPIAPPRVSEGWLAGFGTTFGLGALISSSCCAIPLGLAWLGAGSTVFSGLEFLANWRPYFLGVAALALLTSWVMFFRWRSVARNVGAACRTSASTRRTAALLSIGTTFAALSLVWDSLIEPLAFKLVR